MCWFCTTNIIFYFNLLLSFNLTLLLMSNTRTTSYDIVFQSICYFQTVFQGILNFDLAMDLNWFCVAMFWTFLSERHNIRDLSLRFSNSDNRIKRLWKLAPNFRRQIKMFYYGKLILTVHWICGNLWFTVKFLLWYCLNPW